ncbi:hypothetical protein DFR72_117187 [Lentzea flaviverrucosa]|uniref:Uncharacterized protein n=2 Tax=Lentzea flaviverrucosa TaxID=200379 RepID=A0A1H9XS50_9PSEU|nr:hypothetical protein DFR72_117187 [Lentzea flaviverrucosa]SES48980.1 hypothetical protein SAMN05216195_11730 [Lentzea flaviverrucosa]
MDRSCPAWRNRHGFGDRRNPVDRVIGHTVISLPGGPKRDPLRAVVIGTAQAGVTVNRQGPIDPSLP